MTKVRVGHTAAPALRAAGWHRAQQGMADATHCHTGKGM